MRVAHICLAAAAASALTLTGCSSSGGGVKASVGATSGSVGASSAPATDFPSSADAGSSGSGSPVPTAAALQAAVLDVADISGFKVGKTDTSDSPLPCTPDDPSLTDQVPPTGTARVTFDSDSGQSTFGEELFQYTDEATAVRAVDAGVKGFDCTTGDFDGTKAKIVGVGALTTTPSADSAQQWDFETTDGTLGTAILARSGGIVIGLSFAASKTGASEIIPLKVIDLALKKLAAS